MAWSKRKLCTGFGNEGWGCFSLVRVAFEDLYLTPWFAAGRVVAVSVTFKCPKCGIESDIWFNGSDEEFNNISYPFGRYP